jgi:hypothetical protein
MDEEMTVEVRVPKVEKDLHENFKNACFIRKTSQRDAFIEFMKAYISSIKGLDSFNEIVSQN